MSMFLEKLKRLHGEATQHGHENSDHWSALEYFLGNNAEAIIDLVEALEDSTELLAALARQAGEQRGQMSHQVAENRAALSNLNAEES